MTLSRTHSIVDDLQRVYDAHCIDCPQTILFLGHISETQVYYLCINGDLFAGSLEFEALQEIQQDDETMSEHMAHLKTELERLKKRIEFLSSLLKSHNIDIPQDRE